MCTHFEARAPTCHMPHAARHISAQRNLIMIERCGNCRCIPSLGRVSTCHATPPPSPPFPPSALQTKYSRVYLLTLSWSKRRFDLLAKSARQVDFRVAATRASCPSCSCRQRWESFWQTNKYAREFGYGTREGGRAGVGGGAKQFGKC